MRHQFKTVTCWPYSRDHTTLQFYILLQIVARGRLSLFKSATATMSDAVTSCDLLLMYHITQDVMNGEAVAEAFEKQHTNDQQGDKVEDLTGNIWSAVVANWSSESRFSC